MVTEVRIDGKLYNSDFQWLDSYYYEKVWVSDRGVSSSLSLEGGYFGLSSNGGGAGPGYNYNLYPEELPEEEVEEDPCDANRGGHDIIFGQSFDVTLAAVPVGYTVEGGYYLDGENVELQQFVSNGYTAGWEASIGANLIFIKPKQNFKFDDLEGMGVSGVINLGIVSIALLGNSAPGYPENSVAETYWGVKFGLGLGGVGSVTPSSNTCFKDWIPPLPNNIIIWK